MVASFTPNQWGPARSSKDYEILMEGASCVDTPISLLGHSIQDFSRELSDPVRIPVTEKVRGKIRTFNKTFRPAEITETTFTMGFPNSLWTPALDKARKGGGCTADFFAKYLCPSDRQYEHAYVFPEAVLDPVEFVNSFVTNGTETELIDQTSTVHITEEQIVYAMGLTLLKDQAASVNAIAFDFGDCVGCEDAVFQDMIAVGGAIGIYPSDDRFASQITPTHSLPALSVITGVLSDGSKRIISFRDATSTSGGLAVSDNDGATFTLIAGIANSQFALAKYNNLYLALGGDTGAQAELRYSTNGLTWTSVVSAALPALSEGLALSVDADNNVFYAAFADGKLLSGTNNGSALVLTTLTANLPGIPGDLFATAVLAPGFVAVGGAAGYYAESHDSGITFEQTFTPGANAVLAIAGSCYRTLVGSGAVVFERSVLTDMSFKVITPEQGVAIGGNVTSIARADDNYFLVGTVDGNIFLGKPFYPNA